MAAQLDGGLYDYEHVLANAGLAPVAGADEAGRGACAGPLVAAAVILDHRPGHRIDGLRDSKLLSPKARVALYAEILDKAQAVSWVRVEADECDQIGMHAANIEGLRRALLRLDAEPGFVLTDGFSVDGLGYPRLGMWKGDQVAACVAAASIVAKVTRDRIMTQFGEEYPQFGFASHKGYCTRAHQAELITHGPCKIHRLSFDNVARAARVKQP